MINLPTLFSKIFVRSTNSFENSFEKPAGMLEVNKVTTITAQVEALGKKIDSLSTHEPSIVMACDTCGEGHSSTDCPIIGVAHGPTK